MRRSRFLLLPFVVGCYSSVPSYVNPSLPPERLGHLLVDDRATVVGVDGLYPEGRRQGLATLPPDIYLTPACHVLWVSYKATYVQRGTQYKRFQQGKSSYAGPSEHTNEYESAPVLFFVRVKAGHQYWVTATFTGDVFMPRIAELNPTGESIGGILPKHACPEELTSG